VVRGEKGKGGERSILPPVSSWIRCCIVHRFASFVSAVGTRGFVHAYRSPMRARRHTRTNTPAHTNSHTRAHTHDHTHTHTNSLSLSLYLSRVTRTRTRTHTRTHTHTQAHAHAHTHAHADLKEAGAWKRHERMWATLRMGNHRRRRSLRPRQTFSHAYKHPHLSSCTQAGKQV
jgi:hypothetical protein